MPIGAMSFCLSHRYGPASVATALAYEHRLRQPLSPAEALTYIKRLESIAFFGLLHAVAPPVWLGVTTCCSMTKRGATISRTIL